MNKNDAYTDYFLRPNSTRHIHYEILRARFVEKKKSGTMAVV